MVEEGLVDWEVWVEKEHQEVMVVKAIGQRDVVTHSFITLGMVNLEGQEPMEMLVAMEQLEERVHEEGMEKLPKMEAFFGW